MNQPSGISDSSLKSRSRLIFLDDGAKKAAREPREIADYIVRYLYVRLRAIKLKSAVRVLERASFIGSGKKKRDGGVENDEDQNENPGSGEWVSVKYESALEH